MFRNLGNCCKFLRECGWHGGGGVHGQKRPNTPYGKTRRDLQCFHQHFSAERSSSAEFMYPLWDDGRPMRGSAIEELALARANRWPDMGWWCARYIYWRCGQEFLYSCTIDGVRRFHSLIHSFFFNWGVKGIPPERNEWWDIPEHWIFYYHFIWDMSYFSLSF